MRKPTRIGVGVVALVLVLIAVWLVFTAREVAVESTPQSTTLTEAPSRVDLEAPSSRPRAATPLIPSAVREEPSLAAGAFTGHVVSFERATPVSNAELTFEESGAAFTVHTRADGAFAFLPPRAGVYRLAAIQARGFLPFGPAWGHSPISLVARSGQRVDALVFQLQPERTLEGVVLLPDGSPAAGAQVRVLDSGDEMMLSPSTTVFTADAEGAFTFQAPQGAVLEARLDGYGPGRARVSPGVLLGQRVQLRLTTAGQDVPEPQQLSGRVLDEAGVPAEGAQVKAERERSRGDPRGVETIHPSPSALVDGEGRFTLTGLDPGTYRVRATRPGSAAAVATNVPAGTRDLELRLTRGATVRGAVEDSASGGSVSAFTVALDRKVGLGREPEVSVAILDASGTFEVAGVRPGEYELRVAAFGHAISPPIEVTIADPPVDPPPVRVSLSRGGRVFGRILDEATREPVANARVELEGMSGEAASTFPVTAMTLSDRDGRFELTGLAEGLRSVTITSAKHHGRILAGLAVENDGSIGPVEVLLAPTKEGEEPRIELVGIGAVLTPKGRVLVIERVVPGGGAAEAGLQPGHEIASIGGRTVDELGFEGSVNHIRGAEDSTVVLGIRVPPDTTVRNVTVPRRRVRN